MLSEWRSSLFVGIKSACPAVRPYKTENAFVLMQGPPGGPEHKQVGYDNLLQPYALRLIPIPYT
jgi:hypothetical protein